MKFIPTYLMILFFLVGCGKQEISGQVFIVTKGMGNIKLALVEVGAIPQEEFDRYFTAKQSKKLEKQKLLLPKYELAKKEYDEALNKPGDTGFEQLSKVSYKTYEIRTEFETFDKDEFLLEGLPQPKFVGKTDADGKFTLSLPKGKYVITANSSRSVGSYSETYHWLFWVDASSPNQSLMLSNDNLLITQCNECVKLQ